MRPLIIIFLSVFCFSIELVGQARDPIPDSLIVKPTEWVFTIGLLQGGSIIGADAEYRLFEGVGVQLGTGIFGFGTGLNFHFQSDIESSYVSLMYINQGFGDIFVQSMFGPAYVHRWKNGLSSQFGIGFLSGYGRKWGNRFNDNTPPPVLPMFAFGYYFSK